MRTIFFAAVLVVFGCADDYIREVRFFTPMIASDGRQTFTFLTKDKLPSSYGDADVEKVHARWLARELAARQYCLKGYDIIGRVIIGGDNVEYEGVCK